MHTRLCETGLSLSPHREFMCLFVTSTPAESCAAVHFLVSTTHRQFVRRVMWIPTPIYERIPQFWFLLGLLFIATGLYLGFEFALSFWYIAVGFVCCAYSVGIFLLRLSHRGRPQPIAQAAAPAQPVREESQFAEPAHTE